METPELITKQYDAYASKADHQEYVHVVMLVCPGIYSCDLDLDPMTLIYRLRLDILHTINDGWAFNGYSTNGTDRQTQTDVTKRITICIRGGKKNCCI